MHDKLKRILLIDDDEADNLFHKRIIKKSDAAEKTIAIENPQEALDFLRKANQEDHPDLIFLDINMPKMNGWEFLEEYAKLPAEQQAKAVVVMLSTSLNPDDQEKANQIPQVAKFMTKPLTKEKLNEVLKLHLED